MKKRPAGQGPKEKTAGKVARATSTFAAPQEQFEAGKQTVLAVAHTCDLASPACVSKFKTAVSDLSISMKMLGCPRPGYTMYTKTKNIIQKN